MNDSAHFAALSSTLASCMRALGYRRCERDDAERTLVIGPPEPWVFVGDSAGTTATADDAAFDALSCALSTSLTLVDVQVSDSLVIELKLYRAGRRVDRFANGVFPWSGFEDRAQREAYAADWAIWRDLVADEHRDALRAALDQDRNIFGVLDDLHAAFGWDRRLGHVGYTVDLDGVPLTWDEIVADGTMARDDFLELFWRAAPR